MTQAMPKCLPAMHKNTAAPLCNFLCCELSYAIRRTLCLPILDLLRKLAYCFLPVVCFCSCSQAQKQVISTTSLVDWLTGIVLSLPLRGMFCPPKATAASSCLRTSL